MQSSSNPMNTNNAYVLNFNDIESNSQNSPANLTPTYNISIHDATIVEGFVVQNNILMPNVTIVEGFVVQDNNCDECFKSATKQCCCNISQNNCDEYFKSATKQYCCNISQNNCDECFKSATKQCCNNILQNICDVICWVLTISLFLALPISIIIMTEIYHDDLQCSSITTPYIWLMVDGSVLFVLLFIALINATCCNMLHVIHDVLRFPVLFEMAWMLIGSVIFWRDCMNSMPKPIYVLFWITLIPSLCCWCCCYCFVSFDTKQ
jgi:hypothetical protein